MVVERNLKGMKRKRVYPRTHTQRSWKSFRFEEDKKYLIFANSYNKFNKAIKLKNAEEEIRILEKILSKRK